MNSRLSLILFFTLAWCLSASSNIASAQFAGAGVVPPPIAPGTPAPSFETKTLGNTILRSSSLKGKVTVLDFWATWCPTCKMAMPGLENMYLKFKPAGVRFIGMSLDTDEVKQVGPVSRKLGVTYTITVGPDLNLPACEAYNAESLPSIYLIDRRGIVRWSYSGYSNSMDAELAARIQKLLKEK